MRFSRRRLMANAAGDQLTSPVLPKAFPSPAAQAVASSDAPRQAAMPVPAVAQQSVALAKRHTMMRERSRERNFKAPALPKDAATIETADLNLDGLGANTTVSDIASRTYMTPVLEEFLPDPGADQYTPPVFMYNIYRDIYYSDGVSGGAIDIMEKLAFSDFNLIGLDDKAMRPFAQAVDNMRLRRLAPQVSTELLVHGLYTGQMVWDENARTFSSVIPHNPSFVYIRPNPIFGVDPTVSVDFQGSLRDNGGSNVGRNRNRIAEMNIEGVDQKLLTDQRYTIEQDELIYMIRGGLGRDTRGVSYLKRIVPIWLMEKLLIRGTIDQAGKRQRGIQHLQVGDDEWTPTTEDMRMLAEMLSNAALDPTGAVFVTRNGVNVAEISRGDDFWKWNDIYDWASTAKMKALGINEAVLSGDASLNTMDMAMSVYVEQVRGHRDNITYELFYERMFPRIAVANNTRIKKITNSEEYAALVVEERASGFVERASSYKEFDVTKHAFPRVNWHKRLRPEADQAYLDVLNILKENGVPVPLAMWAASGGMDIDTLISGMEKDGQQRKKIDDWKKKYMPAPEEGGGEEASLGTIKRKSLLERDWGNPEYAEMQNLTGAGKRRLLSAKGEKLLTERLFKVAAEALTRVAQRENNKIKRGTT